MRSAICARSAARARGPQCDSFAPDPLSGAAVPGELLDIDLAAKGGLQIEQECAQIEDRAVGIEVDDEVDIAPRHRVAPRYRAEHTDVARAVALRDSLDLRAALTERRASIAMSPV
jgi:hypothetical protein